MPDGIASAASALRYWERRQEVVSNNLANANTDGFKAERVFARLVGEALPAPDASTDRRAGTYRPTGNPLDMSIQGDGFFVLETPSGEQWSRGGSFRLDAQGFLVDDSGHRALGEHGAIQLTRNAAGQPIDPGTVSIDRSGEVSVGGVTIDRLRMERGHATGSLQHSEGTLYRPDASRESIAITERDVRQGAVEESNVNTVSSLVDLITIQRNYAFAQKMLTTLDGIRGTISNELGKVGG
jgi:flagellar basal body rod protein FlgG